MSENKTLKENIDAIQEFIQSTNQNRIPNPDIINQFSGFGNVKDILLDPNKPSLWKSEASRLLVQELHSIIKSNFPNKYLEIIRSIQSSTLTSYFTPSEIVNPITRLFSDYFEKNKISADVLEPSAGIGAFLKPFKNDHSINTITAFEKDILTSSLLNLQNQSSNYQTFNYPFEEISTLSELKYSKYDLIISNIPFGNYKIYDTLFNKEPNNSPQYRSMNTIHGYFFIKSVELLKPNGFISFITSTGIADSEKNEYIREELLRKCELVSAKRLPNHIFSEAGTKVVSDLLILKRRKKSLQSLNELNNFEKSFLKSTKVILKDSKYGKIEQNINSIFLNDDHTPNENVLGSFTEGMFYDSPIITVTSEKSIHEIGQQIFDGIKLQVENDFKIPSKSKETNYGQLSLFDTLDSEIENQYINSSNSNPTEPKTPEEIILDNGIIAENNLIEGNIYIYQGSPGILKQTAKGILLESLKGNYNNDKLIASFNVLHSYKSLVRSIENGKSDDIIKNNRTLLNKYYDNFKSKYGTFHDRNNLDVLEVDIEGFKLKGLEILHNDNTVVKSDIFHKNIEITTQPKNISDAINSSLNKFGKVDINFISKTLHTAKDEIIKNALENKLLFIEPKINHNFDPNLEYKPNENFSEVNSISYVTKDEFISGKVRFKKAEIEKHFNLITIASDQVKQHSLTLLQENDIPTVNIAELDVKLGEHWVPIKYYEQFSSELLNTSVKIKRLVSNGGYNLSTNSHSYENSTEYAVSCKNNRTYKGSDLIKFTLQGSTPRITYSVKYSDGSSKTFLDREAMSEMQMKILKINEKWREFIISNENISNNLENLYNNTQNIDVEREYTGEHLTFPGLQNFEPYAHQKSGVWQAIVQNGCLIDHQVGAGKTLLMSCQAMELKRLGIANKTIIAALKANTKDIYLDFVKAYPKAKVLYPTDKDFTPDKRIQFFQKIQNNDWDAIIMTHEQFATIPQSRELLKEILEDEITNLQLDLDEAEKDGRAKQDRRTMKGLQKRIENKQVQIQKLSDSLKKDPNLITFDKMGIDHLIVDESQIFKNLEYTTRHSRVAGLGSPEGSARAFNMLIAVRTMQKIHNGDKGVTFCSGTPISNSLIELYLLKKYLRPSELIKRNMPNFDSWARTYAELSRDFEIGVTNEVKPKERFRSFNKVPELARFYRSFTNVANDENLNLDKPKIKQHLVEIENTEVQKVYSQELIKAIQRDNFEYFGYHYTKEQLNAKMLLATQISSKISMDMRLLKSDFERYDGSKLIEAAKNINQDYINSQEFSGTQLVFCDTGTPKGKNNDEISFNLYTELKKILTEDYLIPPNEIQFIHYHDSKTAKKKLFEQVNNGSVRILMGSTTKMGVGVNVQKRVISMHHLDIPWRPSDFTQRNGRGERQGNVYSKKFNNNLVDNYIYATKGTLDAYKYFLVDLKQKFINQIKTKNITSRTIDEGEMDEGSMSPAAFIAQLSGKKELLEKTKIDKRLSELQLNKSVLEQQKRKITQNISYAEQNLPKILKHEELLKTDLVERDKHINPEIDNMYSLKTSSKTIIDKKELSDYLLHEIFTTNSKKELGKVGSFTIYSDSSTDGKEKHFHLSIISQLTNLEYNFGTSKINLESSGRTYRYIVDSLKGIEHKIKSQQNEHKRLTEELNKNKILLSGINVNQYDQEINELVIESNQLALEIEKQDGDLKEQMSQVEHITDLINSENFTECSRYISSIDENNRPDIEDLINSNNNIQKNIKSKALLYFKNQLNNTPSL